MYMFMHVTMRVHVNMLCGDQKTTSGLVSWVIAIFSFETGLLLNPTE